MKVKLDKLDVGIIINALDKTKNELTEYMIEDVNTVLIKWIVVHESMNKQKEKIIIAELEYPVVLKAFINVNIKMYKNAHLRCTN